FWSDDHFKCGQRVCDEGASHLFAPSLGMFNLPELQMMLEQRKAGHAIDQARHSEILIMLRYAARSFEITLPTHWL
ncbi:hypothetical protein ACET98_15485, partial [Aeromonas veronii]